MLLTLILRITYPCVHHTMGGEWYLPYRVAMEITYAWEAFSMEPGAW